MGPEEGYARTRDDPQESGGRSFAGFVSSIGLIGLGVSFGYMRSVYIETSIPSFYFETRDTDQAKLWREHTRRWWAVSAPGFRLVTSSFVLRELHEAPEKKRTEGLALLRDVDLLDEPPELADTIEFYLQHRLMPDDAVGDAAHLAITSLSGIDFLLTWNLKHLANANKFRHLAVLNGRLGLPVPVITTPLSLSHEELDDV